VRGDLDASTLSDVRRATMTEDEAELRLRASVGGLLSKAPEVSAKRVLSDRQRSIAIALVAVIVICAVISVLTTCIVLIGILIFLYLVAFSYRVVLFNRSTRPGGLERVSDEEARSIPDSELPIYTILVPAYQEADVIGLLVTHLGQLEYPADKLDIKVLVEEDDIETIGAIESADPGQQFELVVVPGADPRTKPKALNFGLGLARGDYVTVYDAEDEPEPLQLRRAVAAFSRLPADVACLQAKLSYSNSRQNLITRWFTVEYAMWFQLFLPGLATMNAPIPLGGTSNHFRRPYLQMIGAWDPYNVTEDADLGLRMFREGFHVRVLDSVTYEEANSDFINWVRQRSRWYKGYFQTFLIHMREPATLRRELGMRDVFQFFLFVGGTPLLALLNPLFWTLTIIWFVAHPSFELAAFPAPIYYAGIFCWAFGNFVIAYLTIITCRIIRRPDLLWASIVAPIYWIMMSLAAAKAAIQLAFAPTFWEKTVHGLSRYGASGTDHTDPGHSAAESHSN